MANPECPCGIYRGDCDYGLEDGRAATSSARKATAMALRAIQSVVPYRHWGDIEHAAEFMKVAVDAIEEWLGVP